MSTVDELRVQIGQAAANLDALVRVLAQHRNMLISLSADVQVELGNTATKLDRDMIQRLDVSADLVGATAGRVGLAATKAREIGERL